MKYTKTKYPNIFSYETANGKRYHVRKGYYLYGKKKEACKSNLKTIPEARRALAEIEFKIAEGEFNQSKNMTVDQYWGKYWQKKIDRNQWSPDTEANKVSVYNHHFGPRYGKAKLKDLEREEYENFINSLLKDHRRSTVQQMHGIFMAMLNDAVACGHLYQNTLQKIYIGESPLSPHNKEMTMDDFRATDNAARELFGDYEYTAVRLTYFNLRRSEVVGIKLKTVVVRPDGIATLYHTTSRTKLRPDGKDRNGNEAMKTKGSKRVTVLDWVTSQLVISAIERAKEIAKASGRILGPEDFIFLVDYPGSIYKGKPMPVEHINDMFSKIEAKTGIHITPHMMRHFFVTQGLEAGVSLEHMAAALGHSKSYMTEKYGHIQQTMAERASQVFAQIIQ